MANIATALKEEIARVARKEIRTELEKLKAASTQHRSEIAALKKRVATLEKVVARLEKGAAARKKAKAATDKPVRVRFNAKALITLRQRLGLSGADMAALLGVSTQTIYNWEAEKSRPRQQQLEAFASFRGIGKREAAAKLRELEG
jgi:DNA-binding transcriptional regulator YiaG